MTGRVDFFVIGAQKAGTTALARYLARHPEIAIARGKEAHFFDDETVDWARPRYDRLHSKFDMSAGGMLRGDVTPIYIYWPRAIERLHAYNPEARVIVCLRHPAFRAFSHWRMERGRGSEELSFEEATGERGRARVARAPGGVHRVHSYVERGLYARQIRRLLGIFPREQVHFLRSCALWSQVEPTLADVARFLGISPFGPVARRYVSPTPPAGAATFDAPVRARLDRLFREEILAAEALSDLFLRDWLASDYREAISEDG